VIQANPKILEKMMEKRRRWEAKASTDEGDEQNNFTRIKSRNPM
jgi:hypothetical protein